MDVKMHVCVIGAGMCGLVTTKCMLDAGFDVTCFEKNPYVGGRWHILNKNPIPRSTITNLPKFLSCFSDFPMPDNVPLYMSADRFSEYFELYAKNFGLHSFIKFKHQVMKAEPLAINNDKMKDHSYFNGKYRWRINFTDENNIAHTEEFDYLVVCSGFYSIPYIPPHIETAIKKFEGRIIHSIDYVNSDEFKDKNVLVCGLGNTGGKCCL